MQKFRGAYTPRELKEYIDPYIAILERNQAQSEEIILEKV
jgi:hypothetical protein